MKMGALFFEKTFFQKNRAENRQPNQLTSVRETSAARSENMKKISEPNAHKYTVHHHEINKLRLKTRSSCLKPPLLKQRVEIR